MVVPRITREKEASSTCCLGTMFILLIFRLFCSGSIPVTLSFADALGVNVLLLPMGRGDDGEYTDTAGRYRSLTARLVVLCLRCSFVRIRVSYRTVTDSRLTLYLSPCSTNEKLDTDNFIRVSLPTCASVLSRAECFELDG
jgi:hypothetical protein